MITDSDWKWAESALKFREIIPKTTTNVVKKGIKMNEFKTETLPEVEQAPADFGTAIPSDLQKLIDAAKEGNIVQVDEDFKEAPQLPV